jgi:3-methyladenine DNA glycosylase Tag
MEPPKQIKPKSLDDYLEVMSKVAFQSGMSWTIVEKKWQGTRDAFRDFDVLKVASLTTKQIDALSDDTR